MWNWRKCSTGRSKKMPMKMEPAIKNVEKYEFVSLLQRFNLASLQRFLFSNVNKQRSMRNCLNLPFDIGRTWSVSPSGGRHQRVSLNYIYVQTSVIAQVIHNRISVILVLLNSLSNVVLLPDCTGHIRTVSLPCALACVWQVDWEKEISV